MYILVHLLHFLQINLFSVYKIWVHTLYWDREAWQASTGNDVQIKLSNHSPHGPRQLLPVISL